MKHKTKFNFQRHIYCIYILKFNNIGGSIIDDAINGWSENDVKNRQKGLPH